MTKKKEVLPNFSENFQKITYLNDPIAHAAISVLEAGASPYAVIENLLLVSREYCTDIHKLNEEISILKFEAIKRAVINREYI